MSTLEKAFLKAMSLEDKETDNVVHETEIERLKIDSRIPHSTQTHEIVNSREGIARIEDVDRFSIEKLLSKRFVHANMKDRTLLDRYRNIRTKLLSNTQKENFVTMITSVVPDKNSSLIAANIAATFALDEAKTSMLVEADIENPYLNELFEMSGKKGLIDFLESNEQDSSQFLCKTGIPRLNLVPSGLHRENSGEYFTSSKMKSFITELVNRYPDRYPFINAPCVTTSADTRILIELCDKVVLVVSYAKCSDEQIMQAALAIGEKKLVGIVLDGF